MSPLRHCQSLFDVLAVRFLFPHKLRDLVHDCPSQRTVVQPMFLRTFFRVYLYTSFRPTSQYCTHSSAPIVLPQPASFITLRCLAVHGSLVYLRSKPWTASSHIPSLHSAHSCLAANVFQQAILDCFRSILFTSCGQTHTHVTADLPFKLESEPLRHVTSFAHDGSWRPSQPVSTLVTSNRCFLHAFCCSLLHLPIQTPSAQKSVAVVDRSSSPPKSFTSTISGNETDSFLPAAAVTFSLPLGEMPRACHSTLSQGPSPASSHQPHIISQKDTMEKLTSHFSFSLSLLLPAVSSTPRCLQSLLLLCAAFLRLSSRYLQEVIGAPKRSSPTKTDQHSDSNGSCAPATRENTTMSDESHARLKHS